MSLTGANAGQCVVTVNNGEGQDFHFTDWKMSMFHSTVGTSDEKK